MSVHHPTWELLHPGEGGDIGDRVVTSGHHDVVKLLGVQDLVPLQVLYHHRKVVFFLVVDNVFDNGAEVDEPLYVFLLP